MTDCTMKHITYAWHDRLDVFLFPSQKLEKDKHLKLIVSHLSTDFTYTLNRYYLFIQILLLLWSSYRKLAWVGFEPTTTEFRSDALTDWAIRPWVQLALRAKFIQLLHIYIHIYMYLFIWYMITDRKIFYILLFWIECSTLVLFCPFIRHPLSKFTLRPWFKSHFCSKQGSHIFLLFVSWIVVLISMFGLSKSFFDNSNLIISVNI